MKAIFVIVFVLLLSFLLGYLNVSGLLNGIGGVISVLPTILAPFLRVYNVLITYPNTMVFIGVFLGAHIIRFVLSKLGVYGD